MSVELVADGAAVSSWKVLCSTLTGKCSARQARSLSSTCGACPSKEHGSSTTTCAVTTATVSRSSLSVGGTMSATMTSDATASACCQPVSAPTAATSRTAIEPSASLTGAPGRGRAQRQGSGEEGDDEADDVGTCVGGVDRQCQRARQPRADDLHEQHGRGECKNDEQPTPDARTAVRVIVPVCVAAAHRTSPSAVEALVGAGADQHTRGASRRDLCKAEVIARRLHPRQG